LGKKAHWGYLENAALPNKMMKKVQALLMISDVRERGN
jgi:hypothetical protein